MSKPKRIKDFGAFDTNPFTPAGIERKLRFRRAEQREVYDNDTSQVLLLAEPDRSFTALVDTAPYVKLYRESLAVNKLLSVPATRLFWYVLERLKPGRDQITIDVTDFLDSSGYARSGRPSTVHYYRGITELLDKEYLSKRRGAEHTFFINVNKFFNGDRTRL